MHTLIAKAQEGFSTLNLNPVYAERALVFLEKWITQDGYRAYRPQIEHMIAIQLRNRTSQYRLSLIH